MELASAQVSQPTRAHGLPFSHMLGRCWLVVHLAALAGIGACLWQRAPTTLLTGWTAFVLLNVLLREVALALPARTETGIDHRQLHLGMAAVLGLAWGLGAALLLPYADATALSALLSGMLATALIAIPVLGDPAGAYGYFLGAFVITTVGVLS